MKNVCPICQRILVRPSGPGNSPILLLGEFPGYREVMEGRPWVGPAGEALRSELMRLGIPFQQCRATNLWLHEPVEDAKEIDWHWKQVLKELKGRKAVLLLGSDVVRRFVGGAVSDYSGLRVKSDLLPECVEVAVACYNPASVTLRDSKLGEVRFAIERFADYARRYLK